MKKRTSVRVAAAAVFALGLVVLGSFPKGLAAQSGQQTVAAPKFEVDPFWPKQLPDNWVTGEIGGVCVDAQDHVFILNRGELYPKEKLSAKPGPPVIEFDPDGNVANGWGDRDSMPKSLHGCFVDKHGNIWITGNHDGIVQEYTHDGGKLLLQIGTKGKFDSADGSDSGLSEVWAMNSGHASFNSPAGVAVDPTNGDVYVADGYQNRRVAVFDQEGHFLRQWGRQGTEAEVDAGVGGVFLQVVHCVVIGNDNLVYVCDRNGNRLQVFDKMGNFKRNILIPFTKISHRIPQSGNALLGYTGGTPGTACWLAFSPDVAQTFAYVADCTDDQVRIFDRATGQALSTLGQSGHQAGQMASVHTMAADSKGNIYTAETQYGRRVQKFKLVK
jgi:DNA-binding beta-propeller fold protein YncE